MSVMDEDPQYREAPQYFGEMEPRMETAGKNDGLRPPPALVPGAWSENASHRDDFNAGYDMGQQHGYERATAELLHILQERMKAGVDILPLLPMVDELRARQADILAAHRG